MAHFTRELTDQQWFLGKTNESPALHTALRNIDEKTKKSLNDSVGAGTWAPSNPIIIGGEGLSLYSTIRMNAGSPGMKAAPGPGKYFKFGDNDYFQMNIVHERTIRQGVAQAIPAGFVPREVRSSSGISVFGLRTNARFLVPLTKIANGQRLQSINVSLVSGSAKGRLVRHLADGTISPYVVAGVTDHDGWCAPHSSSIGVNTAVPAPGLLIDISTAEYFFEIQDLNTGGGTQFRYVEMLFWYSDLRFQ